MEYKKYKKKLFAILLNDKNWVSLFSFLYVASKTRRQIVHQESVCFQEGLSRGKGLTKTITVSSIRNRFLQTFLTSPHNRFLQIRERRLTMDGQSLHLANKGWALGIESPMPSVMPAISSLTLSHSKMTPKSIQPCIGLILSQDSSSSLGIVSAYCHHASDYFVSIKLRFSFLQG